MNSTNFIPVSPEPSLQSSRRDRPHPRWISAPMLATKAMPALEERGAGRTQLTCVTEVQNGKMGR